MSALLDCAAVAERLGVSTFAVRALWEAGALPCIEIPSSSKKRKIRRIDASRLEEWIKRHEH
jgi:hypothetical protein